MSRIKSNQNELLTKKSNLINNIDKIIELNNKRYLKNISTLEAVSPLSVLSRGYSIVSDKKGKIISSNKNLEIDQEIFAEFSAGKIKAKVIEKLDEA